MENSKVKAVTFVYSLPEYDCGKHAVKKFAFPYKLFDEDITQFLSSHKLLWLKNLNIIGIVKRVSPFLIIAFCLPVLFACLLIKNMYSSWFFFFLFVFVQINILTIDFAIWNYYKGNKIWRTWLIEMSIIFFALSLII